MCEHRNDPGSGRQRTSTDERIVKLVADALEEDCHATCEELSRATGVPATSVFCTLTNDLKKKKISAPWAPHCLTAEQKLKCLDMATKLKERFDVKDHAFLCRIVTIDETWIGNFELELKSQSNKWGARGSPRPEKNLASLIRSQANDYLCL